jgi:hypothetical protein
MTGTLLMDATRGGRARLSARLDFLTNEMVWTHAARDFLTNENVQTQTPQTDGCDATARQAPRRFRKYPTGRKGYKILPGSRLERMRKC